MIRVRCHALLLLAAISPALIAEPAGKALTQPQATTLLAFYQSITRLCAKFKETKHLKDPPMDLVSEGRLTVIRPDKVIWEVVKPSHLLVTLAEKEVKIESGEGADKRVETITVDSGGGAGSASLKSLVAWMRLDPALLLKDYTIYPTSDQNYEFVPKDKGSIPFESLAMHLKSQGYLESLEIREKSGDKIEIRFEKPELQRGKH